jgi:hypothetical protein
LTAAPQDPTDKGLEKRKENMEKRCATACEPDMDMGIEQKKRQQMV